MFFRGYQAQGRQFLLVNNENTIPIVFETDKKVNTHKHLHCYSCLVVKTNMQMEH